LVRWSTTVRRVISGRLPELSLDATIHSRILTPG